MKLVFLIGPSAVGKELERITDLDLLIETTEPYDNKMVSTLRKGITAYYACKHKAGLIMTFDSLDYIHSVIDVAHNNLLKNELLEVYIVELNTRLNIDEPEHETIKEEEEHFHSLNTDKIKVIKVNITDKTNEIVANQIKSFMEQEDK